MKPRLTLRLALFQLGGWTRRPPDVPSDQNNSVVL